MEIDLDRRRAAARRTASRFTRLAALLGLLAAAPSVPTASAQEAAPLAAPPGVATTVEIAAGEPDISFPAGISFPVEVSSSEPIAEIDLLYHPVGVETLTLDAAEFDPGAAVAIDHELDLRDGSLPAGIDLRWRWRVTEADGDVAETPERVLTWFDDRFSWQEVAGAQVRVHFYGGDAAFAGEVLATAERTIDKLNRRFGAELTDPIETWVYADREDFLSAQAPNSEPWVAGAAYPELRLIQAVLPPGDRQELGRVIPHEISHQVFEQATDNPFNVPPRWLDEGLATLAQEAGRGPSWMRLRAAAEAGQVPPLRTLNGAFPYDTDATLLAYAQSMAVVAYVIDTYGETGLSDLIAVFRDGVTYDQALVGTLGVTIDELDAAWRAGVLAQADAALSSLQREGDGGDGAGGFVLSDWGAWLLASGSIVMGAVALVGLAAGWRAWRRSLRLQPDPDPDPEVAVLADPGPRGGPATPGGAW